MTALAPVPLAAVYAPGVDRLDRLYDLLPEHVRARDQESGQALRALLRVLAEQANVLEDDITRLHHNLFIETCDPWAVPFVAAVVGYRPFDSATLPPAGGLDGDRGRRRLALLAPRREAAHTLTYRRRKGTLEVLEEVAFDVTGWPARAVEFRRRTFTLPHVNHSDPDLGVLPDVRRDDALDLDAGPFGTLPWLSDVRRPGPAGRGEATGVGVYVWPLNAYGIGPSPARRLGPAATPTVCRHADRRHTYSFSPLGHRTPLINRPTPPDDPTRLATEREMPGPIRARAFRHCPAAYYGPGRSLVVWREAGVGQPLIPVPVEAVVPADLSEPVALWPAEVAVDVARGELAVAVGDPQAKPPRLWVGYHYDSPAELGGGPYYRPLETPAGAYRVVVRDSRGVPSGAATATGPGVRQFGSLAGALRWWDDAGERRPPWLIIEIQDDARHRLNRPIQIGPGHRVELRAGQGHRPLLAVGKGLMPGGHVRSRPADVVDTPSGEFILDGLLVAENPLVLQGPLAGVTIRHCTLVPGLELTACGKPLSANSPSLVLRGRIGGLSVTRTILGPVSVQVMHPGNAEERAGAPPPAAFADSILDSAGGPCPAVGSPDCAVAFVRLRAERCTVLGRVEVHSLDLAEDCLFCDRLWVARRRGGCVRFSYLAPHSRTPPRYRCQPDLTPRDGCPKPTADITPRFRSTRYGTPTYALLDPECSPELRFGASDEAEMGAYRDEYFPHREANLRARLAEFTPAEGETDVVYIID